MGGQISMFFVESTLALNLAESAHNPILLRVDTLVTDGIVDSLIISILDVLNWAAAFRKEGR